MIGRNINEELPPSITTIPGRYFSGDTVTLYHGYVPTLKEIAALPLLIGRNEDARYRRGDGRKRIQKYINICLDNDVLYNYQDLGL